jgi:hypothetical protein
LFAKRLGGEQQSQSKINPLALNPGLQPVGRMNAPSTCRWRAAKG